MSRTLTRDRAELRRRALDLRGFGWTQQQIANALNLPQRTISYWTRQVPVEVWVFEGKVVEGHKDFAVMSESEIVDHPERVIFAKDINLSKNGTCDLDNIDQMLSDLWENPDVSREYARRFGKRRWERVPA